jgi:hypothetical protein
MRLNLTRGFGDLLHRPSDGKAAIAVAHQHSLCDLLKLEYGHEVLDVSLEPYLRPAKMSSLSESRQGRRVDVMAGLPQKRCYARPAPAAMAAAVDEHKR